MKRSRSIRLVLIGGISASALSGCGPSSPAVNTTNVFTNNHYIPGAGYYHAPFRGWYSLPYNHFDARTSRYFYGGQWSPTPHQSVVNISPPLPQAVSQVAAQRTDIRRSGFGSSSRHYSIGS